jgi:hypothetical protein
MFVSEDFGQTWKRRRNRQRVKRVLIISPGAGTYHNKKAYDYLQEFYSVVFVDTTSRREGFIYPKNWNQNDQLVLGKDDKDGLKGLANKVGEEILKNTPDIIVCGSRGSQVTIGLVWRHYWRGPTVCINAGPLTSHTKIYKEVQPLMVTMEHDYFKTQDETQEKYHAVEAMTDGLHVYLLSEDHVPEFKPSLFKLIIDASLDHTKIKSVQGEYLVSKLTQSLKQEVTVQSLYRQTVLRKFPNSEHNNWTTTVKNGEKVSVLDCRKDEKGYTMLKVQPQQNKKSGWIYTRNILEYH